MKKEVFEFYDLLCTLQYLMIEVKKDYIHTAFTSLSNEVKCSLLTLYQGDLSNRLPGSSEGYIWTFSKITEDTMFSSLGYLVEQCYFMLSYQIDYDDFFIEIIHSKGITNDWFSPYRLDPSHMKYYLNNSAPSISSSSIEDMSTKKYSAFVKYGCSDTFKNLCKNMVKVSPDENSRILYKIYYWFKKNSLNINGFLQDCILEIL